MLTNAADFASALRAEIGNLHNRRAEQMVQGQCKDWPDYQRSAGYVEALTDMRKAIDVVIKRNDDIEGMLHQ